MSRTVFITGANSGVGLATTKIFLSNGWNVAATARRPAAATDLQQLVKSNEAHLLVLGLDLVSPETFQPALDATVEKFGKIDVLINNAGYGQFGMMEALSMEDYRRQFEVNIFGPIALTKILLAHFITRSNALFPPQIIYISSGAAHFGLPLSSPYNGSKAALNLFAESVSHELGALNPPVTVKIIVIHGGVKGTNFNNSSNSAPVLDSGEARGGSQDNPHMMEMQQRYGAYAARVFNTFGSIATGSMPVDTPAKRIFEAATDGTKKLRYFIGGSEEEQPILARMKGMKEGDDEDAADDRYFQWMKNKFA
ncbi:NAD(P)-binding protein [Xylariaceae sp. AK1471]|nr:NAD(P)-binding protein [Xylariaceae sp. AK1471]